VRAAWAHDWQTSANLTATFIGLPTATFVVNGAPPPKSLGGESSNMQSEKAGDHNDHDHNADDVENIHCFAPIETCTTWTQLVKRGYHWLNSTGVFWFPTD
jgi:hypothetical protein